MKIAIDCRMIGSGGIGSYVSELVPHFLENNECLLLGTHEQCMDFVRMANVEFCYCDVKPFSFEEMFSFPKEVLDKIHQYDFYFTPYCNIPGGIRIPVFSTIHLCPINISATTTLRRCSYAVFCVKKKRA